MRRASTCLAVLGGLVVLGLPAAAQAELPITAEIVSFKAKAVPVPKSNGHGTWPKTGNFFGKGAAVEAEYVFKGSGYKPTSGTPAGGIPPISQVNFYLPAGAKLHPSGFGTCTAEKLKNEGAKACPTSSIASPVGSVLGEVGVGAEHVEEATTLQAFFGEGGLLFLTEGATPVQLTIVSSGKYKPSHVAGYGEELETIVPAVPTLSTPTGPILASVRTIKIKAGAAIKKGNGPLKSYGTLPEKCKGGLLVKTEVFFGGEYGGERNFGFPVKKVEATFKAPCPKKLK